jgi:hypothetical protein
MHTMLCLITKGVHLEGYSKGKRSDDPNTAKRNAYLTFVTTLNDALHGTNYEHDIHKKEVTRMLDHVLLKHKAIVGKGGLTERQFGGRVTRALRFSWQRSLGAYDPEVQPPKIPSPLDFDGSISEWNQWRRKTEENKRRARFGLPPLQVLQGADEEADAGMSIISTIKRANRHTVQENASNPTKGNRAGQTQKRPSVPGRNRWRGQQNALSEEYVVDEADQGKIPTMASNKIVQTNLDSFRVLPSNIRNVGKYQWANPEAPNARQQAFLGGLRGASAIAAFQNTGAESSQGFGDHDGGNSSRSYSRHRGGIPLNKPRSFLAGRKSSACVQGSSESVPGLTHDDSSSDGIEASTNTPVESAVNHPRFQSSGSITPIDLKNGNSDPLAKGLESKPAVSKEDTLEEDEVEMADLDEGEIWRDFEAARGLLD